MLELLQREVEKVRKRKADREAEKAQMEQEQAEIARERAYAETLELQGKEEEVLPSAQLYACLLCLKASTAVVKCTLLCQAVMEPGQFMQIGLSHRKLPQKVTSAEQSACLGSSTWSRPSKELSTVFENSAQSP